ncbi:NAD+ synthase [Solicola sp. PLA-1-18]|uniref:NAD+ synthase n=1 Tax=Solicola sp. PLA-1-18 TaxID=3380532 RepID=UPI003B7A547F
MPQLRLALAQVNTRVGDLAGNAEIVVERCRQAHQAGAHLVVFPEMALTGYPIEDLAMRATIIRASQETAVAVAARLAEEGMGDLVAVVGFLDRDDEMADAPGVPKNAPLNSVAVMHGGRIVARQAKHHLWNYGVGDEIRNFVPGHTINVVQVHGVDVAIAICEDLWRDGPSAAAKAADAALLVVPNGSPYEADKDDVRLDLCARRAVEGSCALAYVNLVGGQDELVFDGDSIVVDAEGRLVARSRQFVEELVLADLDLPAATPTMPGADERFGGLRIQRTIVSSEPVPAYEPQAQEVVPRLDSLAERWHALVLGLRDYVEKNGFRSVLMGLSGGIDSTLVGAIAVDALGADRVFGVSNPSDWSTEHSRTDAAELARRTGLTLDTVPIAPIFDAYQSALHVDGLAEENLQARVRAVIWMALSNQHGHLVLACGNKSELATGYSTIYGDAVGGYAPIKDVPKTLVWELSRWRNAEAERRGETPPIPENAISKPPSAELRPGQLDSDSLPEYDLLDGVLDAYVERGLGAEDVVAEGFDRELVQRVVTLVDRAEYKRRQYPPGPKISRRNFGRDRRVPITNAWREQQ